MSHPFPKGSFKITSQRQIDILRGLDLPRIRFVPTRSDPPPEPDPVEATSELPQASFSPVQFAPAPAPPAVDEAQRQREHHAALIAAQNASLALCDQQFDKAIRQYRQVIESVATEPLAAATLSRNMVESLVGDMMGHSESSIRLLSESTGDRAWMHPVNVTVLSLLLGKALGMAPDALRDLGVAAFLHDVGKIRLPDRVRLADVNFAPAEYKQYQSHVAHGVAIAQHLELSLEVQRTICLHHEMIDGSGFPRNVRGTEISQPGKVLALVNRYENMCNPLRASASVTPHEALSLIFAQMKDRYDTTVLAAFIRMMGVYPPGSVVQLSDGRYALVVSVNSARPLKPRVIVHEPSVAKEQALILDLEQQPTAGIRRSVRPDLLPRPSIDYLAPRLRICYFFERAADPVRGELVP
jgi:HD-GYP domain-containing protein (c-di-GMP phosphodiesterase class II)